MSIPIGLISAGSARLISISPAVSGKSVWNFDIDGALTLSTAGSWTITPLTSSFNARVEMWGGGGGAPSAAGGTGGSGTASTLGSLQANGGGGAVNNSPGAGGTATGGDTNETGGSGTAGSIPSLTGGHGGASPSGGAGGAGGVVTGNGEFPGGPGTAPGGAAGGSAYYQNSTNTKYVSAGAGAGAHLIKLSQSFVSGTPVTATVGSAGTSAVNGATGKIIIT